MAGPIRKERIRSQIKTEVARILQTDIKDPRAKFVTVINVDVSGDLRYAKIYVSVLAASEGKVLLSVRSTSQFPSGDHTNSCTCCSIRASRVSCPLPSARRP